MINVLRWLFSEYSFVLTLTVLISMGIWGWSTFAISREPIIFVDEKFREDSMVKYAVNVRNKWFSMAQITLVFSYLGTIIPFEASAIVVYLTASGSNAQNQIITFSIIAMAFVIIPCIMRPMIHAKAYRKAFERIHSALVGFDGDQEVLKEALIAGEHDINEIYEIDRLWKRVLGLRDK